MLHNYVIINEVNERKLDLFDSYWRKYYLELPAFPSILHKGMDQKAVILNIWLLYSDVQACKTLKLDRTFSHSFMYRLYQKNISCLPDNSPLLHFPKAYEYHFLYAYYFGIEIISFLEEIFVEDVELKTLLKGNSYYNLTDADFEPNDDIYKIIKQLYVKAFNPTLNCSIYMKMHSKVTNLLNKQYDAKTLLTNKQSVMTTN